jgi:catalase
MSTDLKPPPQSTRARLGGARTLARLALIGAILAAVAAGFAYLGGRFTPNDLTPARFVDGFEHVNDVQAGFRRNHAKGVCVSGHFESNGDGVRLSKALVFQAGTIRVLGRFSLGGGQPYVGDSKGAVRGLGLQFTLPDGEVWRTAMIHLPVFPFRTPEAFYEQLLASKPDPKTGEPDPAKQHAFRERHPETVRALEFIGKHAKHTTSSGFGDSTYYGLNAFRFTNAAGDSIPVRWKLTPEPRSRAEAPGPASHDKNYLFNELIAEINKDPLRWHLIITIGQPGDATNDATLPWGDDREEVDVGILTLDGVESDDTSATRDINFDPLVLPAGIAPSDDPLLSARSAVYSQSYTRRAGETKQPSAITPADARKGD